MPPSALRETPFDPRGHRLNGGEIHVERSRAARDCGGSISQHYFALGRKLLDLHQRREPGDKVQDALTDFSTGASQLFFEEVKIVGKPQRGPDGTLDRFHRPAANKRGDGGPHKRTKGVVAFRRSAGKQPAGDSQQRTQPVETARLRVIDPMPFEKILDRGVGMNELGTERVEDAMEQRIAFPGGVDLREKRDEPIRLKRHGSLYVVRCVVPG